MPGSNPFDIPYRLDSAEVVAQAMQANFMEIGRPVYRKMLSLAEGVNLETPPALRDARKKVSKNFLIVRNEKVRELNVHYDEIASLDIVDSFSLIEEAMPGLKDLVGVEAHAFLSRFPMHMQQVFSATEPVSLSNLVEIRLALSRLLKQEMYSYVTTQRTKNMTVDQFKQLLALCAIHDVRNSDVMIGLKAGTTTYQNACAELLFVRLPRFIERLVFVESHTIRHKLFSKIAKLDMPSQQKMNLYRYFPMNVHAKDLFSLLSKIDVIVQRMSLHDVVRSKLRDYLRSLIQSIQRARLIYADLFLKGELEYMQKLYVPKDVMKSTKSYHDVIISTYTRINTLEFYPTKDYLDLCKGRTSDDCSNEFYLGEKHLLTPNFFNIRIFRDSQWIGNIYMLDLTIESEVLLLDRIQIPRYIDSDYVKFFDHLKEALDEMFAEVGYRFILVPRTISNHNSIQKVFNRVKDRLPKETLKFGVIGRPVNSSSFESLGQGPSYYVLSEKLAPAKRGNLFKKEAGDHGQVSNLQECKEVAENRLTTPLSWMPESSGY